MSRFTWIRVAMTRAQCSHVSPCRTPAPLLRMLWMISFCWTNLEICEISKVNAKDIGSWTNPSYRHGREWVCIWASHGINSQCLWHLVTNMFFFKDIWDIPWEFHKLGWMSRWELVLHLETWVTSCRPNEIIVHNRRPIVEWASKQQVVKCDWIMCLKWGQHFKPGGWTLQTTYE